jgi:hypothetical protein
MHHGLCFRLGYCRVLVQITVAGGRVLHMTALMVPERRLKLCYYISVLVVTDKPIRHFLNFNSFKFKYRDVCLCYLAFISRALCYCNDACALFL